MCGIFGVINDKQNSIAFDKKLSDSLNKLYSRGPDAHGRLVLDIEAASGKSNQLNSKKIFLGHRRLSIIDTTEAGTQPMSSLDGRYHIVFNGEIYNYIELKEELKCYGYKFFSGCDTEVLLVAFIHWEEEVLSKLTGMFAFAIYDSLEQILFMARDFFGIKPLYYSHTLNNFSFSSEIEPLLDLFESRPELNPQKIYDYLQFGLTDSDSFTLINSIEQLPAAHFLRFDANESKIISIERYWKLNRSTKLDISFPEAAVKLRDLFMDSVQLHMRSDVPIGAALSGGIDSSAIVCAIKALRPESELHTFTYISDDRNLSEEKWANVIGNYVGAKMHKVKPSSQELLEDMDDLIRIQGEPFGSTSIYAQYRVFKLAKAEGIKVMLDGQGADEMFAGYSGYAGARLASLLKTLHPIEAYKFLRFTSMLPGRGYNMILKRTLNYFIPTVFQPIARKLVGRNLSPEWLDQEWFVKRNVKFSLPARCSYGRDCLKDELARSLETVSIPSLLRYEDRNSMAHSIESRVPFLNHKLVEFVFSLPEEFLIDRNGVSKAVFREAMRGIVPDSILDRQDKIGFATSEQKWLNLMKPWVSNKLLSSERVKFLRSSKLKKEWEQVAAGHENFDWKVWRWLNFLHWLEIYQIET